METVEKNTKPAVCPHCGGTLHSELISKLMSESRVSFVIHPHPGEQLSAATFGKALGYIDKALCASGEAVGVKTHVLIDRLSSEDGSLRADLLVTRIERGVTQREATKAE